ncbi:MAG: MotA/TolQ/ExbB proton channel family protein [Clostridia bacterium]|jgi:chemotaxis protein MotA
MALVGVVLAILLVIYGILENGQIITFYDLPSIYIVIGGTIGALLCNYPLKDLITSIKAFTKVVKYKTPNRKAILDKIVELAYASKKEGLLALEKYTEEMKDDFFKKGLLLIVDGTSPEDARNTLESEISITEQHDKLIQDIYGQAAKLSPAFGMIGTLIGLINMLQKLNDVSNLGTSMSVALVTTFYGAFLANVLFIPAAGRLKFISDTEVENKTMMLEGILAIQAGESPYLIKEKLSSYIIKSGKEKKEESEEEKV